jgi:hypothetical protein
MGVSGQRPAPKGKTSELKNKFIHNRHILQKKSKVIGWCGEGKL